MNFLIKIEEAINRFIIKLFLLLKSLTPHFIFKLIALINQMPAQFLNRIKIHASQIKILGLKIIGYLQFYLNLCTTFIRGKIVSLFIYLRSDEFKKLNKLSILLKPITYLKAKPLPSFYGVVLLFTFGTVTHFIFLNINKIYTGIKAHRAPASLQPVEEDLILEFKNYKFEVEIAHDPQPEYNLYLDIMIEAINPQEKIYLEKMKDTIVENFEILELPIKQLPLSLENLKKIEEMMALSLNQEFNQIEHRTPVKKVSLKEILPGRPAYFKQTEKLYSMADLNLQIFLEDTSRNHQIWLDFTLLTSNRNLVLFLNDHEVELKDHLMQTVEPVVPALPIEEEGKQIIKEKIKAEVNIFLEKNKIEGKILDVYLSYILAT